MEMLKKLWNWIGTDRLLHIETSALIVLACPKSFGIWAYVIAVAFGMLKEIYDLARGKNNTPQVLHDFACNAIGLIIAMVISLYR